MTVVIDLNMSEHQPSSLKQQLRRARPIEPPEEGYWTFDWESESPWEWHSWAWAPSGLLQAAVRERAIAMAREMESHMLYGDSTAKPVQTPNVASIPSSVLCDELMRRMLDGERITLLMPRRHGRSGLLGEVV